MTDFTPDRLPHPLCRDIKDLEESKKSLVRAVWKSICIDTLCIIPKWVEYRLILQGTSGWPNPPEGLQYQNEAWQLLFMVPKSTDGEWQMGFWAQWA